MLYWKRCQYMRENEPWGDPRKMNGLLVLTLDIIREEAKRPLNLSSPAWTASSGHSPNSFHYRGMAADFRIEGYGLPAMVELVINVLNQLGIQNYGLGAYTHWDRGPGLHLDLRPQLTYWVSTEPGQYIYFKDKGLFIKSLSL